MMGFRAKGAPTKAMPEKGAKGMKAKGMPAKGMPKGMKGAAPMKAGGKVGKC